MIRHFVYACAAASFLITQPPDLWAELPPLLPRDAELPQVEMPKEFALVLSFGYVQDHCPTDPQMFEYMVKNMARTGINTLHCVYTDWRHDICKQYGVRMLIDLSHAPYDLKRACICQGPWVDVAEDWASIEAELSQAHDQAEQSPDETTKAERQKALAALELKRAWKIRNNVREIARKVRGSDGVWGYGLWYDNGTNGRFLNAGIDDLRQWDPSHVTFVGSYRYRGLDTVGINPGCYGWYDFHWTRGIQWHYSGIHALWAICQVRQAIPGRYAGYGPSDNAEQRHLQNMYTANQTIAAGGKMLMWFIGGPIEGGGGEWRDEHDLVLIASELRHLYRELMKIGIPNAIYSTTVTRTHDNNPVDPPIVPNSFTAFPAEYPVRPIRGEAMCGFFTYRDGTKALFVANHNAYASQEMAVQFTRDAEYCVELLDRESGEWKKLDVKDNVVTFELDPGGGELLRVVK